MNASPKSVWTPEQAYPDAASSFAELRRRLGKPAEAEIAVVTATGSVDPSHPAFAAGAIVLTSDAGAAALGSRLPAESIISVGASLTPAAIIRALAERGRRLIHSEGGPHAIAPLIKAGLVDELFLTVSPILAGRPPGQERFGLIEGADLLAGDPTRGRLIGVRRDQDHLFLRYALQTRSVS
jgi:riboflavin biosynthesis pyrimidine reductase